jgi:hypothetical protein
MAGRLTRPSTTFFVANKDVDARHKAGHDGKKTKGRERSRPFFFRHSGMRHLAHARNPYSFIVVMDSGLALRAPRNDDG